MIRKIIFSLSILLFTFISVFVQGGTKEVITLNLPESVIARAVTAMLPLTIDAHSNTIQGDITIISISALRLTKNHLACRLHLAGKNLAFVTEIAGHEIRLKVGSVKIALETIAAIRFDPKKQILFLKPLLQDISVDHNSNNANISQALVAILNGREFPIHMQKIDPLIASTGTKILTINTQITDIRANNGFIQLNLLPSISATKTTSSGK